MEPNAQTQPPTAIPQGFTTGTSKRSYPIITASKNTTPKRLWAFPVIGGFIKIIFLIPQQFMLTFAWIAIIALSFVNFLTVLFRGKFWQPYYDWSANYFNLHLKTDLYFFGITDNYPGFSYGTKDNYSLKIPLPTVPNRMFAIPLFGLFVRFILMLPFIIYSDVVGNASVIMVVFSSIPVLFKGYYPESTHEFALDGIRLRFAQTLYFLGISDTYPTFKISKHHLLLKLLFIIPGVILSFLNIIFRSPSSHTTNIHNNNQIQYNSKPPNY